MKKVLLLILSLVLINGCTKKEAIYLDEDYYEKSEFVELENQDLLDLEKNKESFIIVVYNRNCLGSADFTQVVEKYLEENQIKIYKIQGKNVNQTKIEKKIKFYPTMVMYRDGKIIDFLDAQSDKDTLYYQDIESLNEWITKYVKMKE